MKTIALPMLAAALAAVSTSEALADGVREHRRERTLGVIAGAVAGAAIGHHLGGDEADVASGALIGAGVGWLVADASTSSRCAPARTESVCERRTGRHHREHRAAHRGEWRHGRRVVVIETPCATRIIRHTPRGTVVRVIHGDRCRGHRGCG